MISFVNDTQKIRKSLERHKKKGAMSSFCFVYCDYCAMWMNTGPDPT